MRKMLLLLALTLAFAVLPLAVLAEEEVHYLFAASDFQGDMASDTLISVLSNIVSKGYEEVDALVWVGDYSYGSPGNPTERINALKRVYTLMGWSPEMEIFSQGNHDTPDSVAATGAHDTDWCGVYAIREDDFPLGGDDETVKKTAAALEDYLNAKLECGYAKPIFMASHIPLHATSRKDNPQAYRLFNVINGAAAKGLNIYFLTGHNHSGGYDTNNIYWTRGDKISVYQGTTSSAKTETLAFTYMNPGYMAETVVGYTQSASVFEVSGNAVTIHQFTATEAQSRISAEKLLASVGRDVGSYTELDTADTLHGYYDSTGPSALRTWADDALLYYATKIFAKSQLPVGSLIIIEEGYQYRPEAWVKMSKWNDPALRPGVENRTVIEIDEEWWGDWRFRAFNVCHESGRPLTNSDLGRIHIFVPNK